MVRRSGRCFFHEHPASASSWGLSETQELEEFSGAWKCKFDQCQFGLRTPYTHMPIRKRTILLTNSVSINDKFAGKLCRGHCGKHFRICGQVVSRNVAAHCAIYPPDLCSTMALAVREEKDRQLAAAGP